MAELRPGYTILAIESSCDETAAAVVRDGRIVLSDVVATQIDTHRLYGGVVPEIASRQHVEAVTPVVRQALADAGLALDAIDAIAVTRGPGLAGALLVGLSYAKGLAWAAGKPLIGVNHMEAHICANYLGTEVEPPFLCLVVSGGHTELLDVPSYGEYHYLGGTLDDAAGEAFDKTARVLGLGYPGGKLIDELAARGNGDAYAFPRALLKDNSFDFSFSGMKTAVIQLMHREKPENIADAAAAIQNAIVEVLVTKTVRAAQSFGHTRIALAGGVAANRGLRRAMEEACASNGWSLFIPPIRYCTDNAAMVAAAAYRNACAGRFAGFALNADPSLDF